MGFLDRILGRRPSEPDLPVRPPGPAPSSVERYVPQDGNPDRFIDSDGLPPLHLLADTDRDDVPVLRLCEDATGLLVSPTDPRLSRSGIHVSPLRGQAFHRTSCRAGDFCPGRAVRLVRDLAHEFDHSAVAVYDHTGRHMAGHLHKQQARSLVGLIDAGVAVAAISIRGTGPGVPCDDVTVLAAPPQVLHGLLEPPPGHLPAPTRHS